MPDRVRQVKAEALKSIEGVNTVLRSPPRPPPCGGRPPEGEEKHLGRPGVCFSRVLVREQTETALEPARQALDGSGILYTVHTGTGDKAEQYERCEASGREVIRQTG